MALATRDVLILVAEERRRAKLRNAFARWMSEENSSAPQREFWASDRRFVAFAGGIGSGKSFAGCVKALRMPPGSKGMIVGPTFPLLRDTTVKMFLELARECGLLASEDDYHSAEMRVDLADGKEVTFRTAEHPDRLRGSNLGWVYLDEAAMMDEQAWLIAIGRARIEPELVWATTTPAGYNWLYSTFTDAGPDYQIIRSRTRDNRHLSAEYIASLEAAYHGRWRAQELDGEFVALESAGVFFPEKIRIVDAAPATLIDSVRSWDLAATLGGGDYTVGFRLGAVALPTGPYHIGDVRREQLDPSGVDALIEQTASMDGRGVRIRVAEEPGSSGKADAQHKARMLAGYQVTVERESGDKVVRARAFASQVNVGNVTMLRGPWNKALIEELRHFPSRGIPDDQVDAGSGAFNLLTLAYAGPPVGGTPRPAPVKDRLFAMNRNRLFGR